MSINRRAALIALLGATFIVTWSAFAYVEAPMSLGSVVAQSSNVLLMQVERVDKEKNLIIYRKVQDIKGKHNGDVIKHNIGRGGLRANEWKAQMDWAEPGKLAVFFYNGGASETCIGTWWYQAYQGGEWWNHSHGEPFLLRSYCGPPEKLVGIVGAMTAGQEVVVPCMVDGNKEELHQRRAKIQRLKASLKLLDYNPKRDFVGWGGEDFRRLLGSPGFSHVAALGRVDPEAQAISVADIDGDGKPDVCLVGAGRVTLLQNGGEAMSEIMLPQRYGARAAVWADHNCDGKPDLLLATPQGPRLFTNLGGSFRDDSSLLPGEPYFNLTAAAWLDYNGDGKPDIVLANGYHGLRLYKNNGKAFSDVSAEIGFGPDGIAAHMKGDTLTIRDVNGDGRPDILFGAGTGMLLLSTKSADGASAFSHAADAGLAYAPGKIGPVFGDFDGDGFPDVVIPGKGAVKLWRNDGTGRFTDVSAGTRDLGGFTGWATSAAWGDFDNDGHLDLVVGCLRGPNRYFRNKGDGTFEDATDQIGLGQTIYNSQAVALVDLNNDGILDMVFNNEGQDSTVLLGSKGMTGKRMPLTLNITGKDGVVGSRVQVADKAGKIVGTQEISGGDGRGGQEGPIARFALDPGAYRVSIRYSSGLTRSSVVAIDGDPVRRVLDDQVPKSE